MQIYIVKDALTLGVVIAEGTILPSGRVKVENELSDVPQQVYAVREWAPSEEAARSAFEALKARKIEGLQRQIDKFKSVQFRIYNQTA